MRATIPLDSPVEAFKWTEHGTCTTPAVYFQFQGSGNWNHVIILVAARIHPSTGEMRWYSAYDCAYQNWSGSALPGLGSKAGMAPPLQTMQAAAADCIKHLLATHTKSWFPLMCPTALGQLTSELQRLTSPVQLSLF